MRRVVATGIAGISPLGDSWPAVEARLRSLQNAVVMMEDWQQYDGLNTALAVPVQYFSPPEHFTHKQMRSMSRVSLLAVTRKIPTLASASAKYLRASQR